MLRHDAIKHWCNSINGCIWIAHPQHSVKLGKDERDRRKSCGLCKNLHHRDTTDLKMLEVKGQTTQSSTVCKLRFWFSKCIIILRSIIYFIYIYLTNLSYFHQGIPFKLISFFVTHYNHVLTQKSPDVSRSILDGESCAVVNMRVGFGSVVPVVCDWETYGERKTELLDKNAGFVFHCKKYR